MSNLFFSIKKEIESKGYEIIGHDFDRPWGGFLLINDAPEHPGTKFLYSLKSKTTFKALILLTSSDLLKFIFRTNFCNFKKTVYRKYMQLLMGRQTLQRISIRKIILD